MAPVETKTAAVLPVIVGAVGGWFAPHTPRGTDPAVFDAGMLAELKQHTEAAAEEVGVTLVKVIARELPQAAAAAAGTAAALAPMQRAAAAPAGPAADPAPVPAARQTASAG